MKNYAIITDSCIDLNQDMVKELDIQVAQLEVIVEGGKPRPNDQVDIQELYEQLRAKKTITTSAVNVGQFLNLMEPILQAELDILYLGFTSPLSATYGAAVMAMEELRGKYPARKLYAVDTLNASVGQGLLVYHACQMRNAGATIEAVRDFAEDRKQYLRTWLW